MCVFQYLTKQYCKIIHPGITITSCELIHLYHTGVCVCVCVTGGMSNHVGNKPGQVSMTLIVCLVKY